MVKRALLIASMFLYAACGWTSPSPGESILFARFGKVDPQTYTEGLQFYNPFTTSAYRVDTKVRHANFETTGASKDLQDVHLKLIVNFQVDAAKAGELLKEVGPDFFDRVINPAVHEVPKAAVALFPAERIIHERPKLKDTIVAGLKARLEPYHIKVVDVSLTNIEFSKQYSAAIEAKQIEEQNVQKTEYFKQQAKIKAEQYVIEQRAQAEANVITAKAQAEANQLKKQTLTQELLQFEAIQKWDGVLPQVTAGATPFINLKEHGK